MNKLSTEVTAIETHEKAIGYFKATEQFAYKFFMEVKKIKDERLFRELGFSTFEEYCTTNFNLTRRFIDQKIQIANTFGEESGTRVPELGHRKALFLSRLEPEEREDFIQSNQVDKMTVLQLQQAIKEKKQAEARIAELENRKPEVKIVEKEVVKEVLPNDYQQLKEKSEAFAELEKSLKLKETQLQEIKKEDSEYNSKRKKLAEEIAELENKADEFNKRYNQNTQMAKINVKMRAATSKVRENSEDIKMLIKQSSHMIDNHTKTECLYMIESLEIFCDEIRNLLAEGADIIDY